jgi:hypothetical protein
MTTDPATPYPTVDPKRRFPELEADILEFWQREGVDNRWGYCAAASWPTPATTSWMWQ